ncbi:MAG: toprim domain-containing protein [Cyanobacteria bacterium SZAS LIN-3]|nr:toprim domain-containing protein [Cyanobacteria bacterium SZAS LIN-3]
MLALAVTPAEYYGSVFAGLTKTSGKTLVSCCFHSDRTPSLSLNLDTGWYHCFACGAGGDLIDFYMRRYSVDFKQAKRDLGGQDSWHSQRVVAPVNQIVAKPRALLSWESARKLWNKGQAIAAVDPVGKYLARRGLTLTAYPTSLRYVPALGYFSDSAEPVGYFPAMLAIFQNQEEQVTAFHKTYLTEDGQKLTLQIDNFKAKKLSRPTVDEGIRGSAIRLGPVDKVVAIAEGIETALSYSQLTGVPTWASGYAGGIPTVWLPPSVETVHICIDNDDAGMKAATALEARLLSEGKQVIKKPLPSAWTARKGADWNNVIMESKI